MKTEVAGYERLAAVLQAALDQASKGKGAERHANNLPFEEQRMLGISHLLDSDGGLAYQACKKVAEARGLSHDARERELLGAINYIAGMVIFHQDRLPTEHKHEPAGKVILGEGGLKLKPSGPLWPHIKVPESGEPDMKYQPRLEPAASIDDESDRQKIIQQGGELAEHVYPAVDAAINAPSRPRHICSACGGGHSLVQCNPVTPAEAVALGGQPAGESA